MRRRLALSLAVLLAAAPACRRAEGPADAYRAFAAAAREGDAAAAWNGLSEASRAALDARAKELSARTDGAVPASGAHLLLGRAARSAPRIANVVVVRESAGDAVVRVEGEGGGAREVPLVREGGRWRVVLPSDI